MLIHVDQNNRKRFACYLYLFSSVADLIPDPVFHYDADPDPHPAFDVDADPDLTS
jgi:hypothetical protein